MKIIRFFKPINLLTPLLLILLIVAGGCSAAFPSDVSEQVERLFPSIVEPSRTPFQPVRPTPTNTTAPTRTPEPVKEVTVWISPALPAALLDELNLPAAVVRADEENAANLTIGPLSGGGDLQVTWVYALVAPFPTITDSVSLEEIQHAWRGEEGQAFNQRLIMAESTQAAFEARWGPPSGARLEVLPEGDLLDTAWADRSSWAIVPFEKIEPRWKVLRVDELSPLDRGVDLAAYPLTIWFGVGGNTEMLALLDEQMRSAGTGEGTAALFPPVNRDLEQMTTLVMTGVTALARATGYKMDTLGTTYPGQDIAEWLRSADLTHISNEVSFNPDCPKANYADTSTIFCSRPEYIELLDFIGADIIELSGNHNNDWGRSASSFSLELYQERGWYYFAGGANVEEARQPVTLTHNGNRLAFIGCNTIGPNGAWATETQPGAAPCGNKQWLYDAIKALRDEGYLPIVTFQYAESYVFNPTPAQEEDFRAVVEAGAILVSGSQAHFPQTLEFKDGALIHYGLGNLFFDQMDDPVVGTRREFIDRHIFYQGRHIQTELLTALLEDYARPRPMTESERRSFLSDIFSASGW